MKTVKTVNLNVLNELVSELNKNQSEVDGAVAALTALKSSDLTETRKMELLAKLSKTIGVLFTLRTEAELLFNDYATLIKGQLSPSQEESMKSYLKSIFGPDSGIPQN